MLVIFGEVDSDAIGFIEVMFMANIKSFELNNINFLKGGKHTLKKAILISLLLVVAVVTCFSFGQYVIRGEEANLIMKEMPEDMTLRHPRRGQFMTTVGDKIWITGGRSYQSHYLNWGKNGHEMYINYPNVEYLDMTTGKMVQTNIVQPKSIYKSVAFTVPSNPSMIYFGGEFTFCKLNTVRGVLSTVEDYGIRGDFTKASAGMMTIKGKKYVVLVGVKKIFFFDPVIEKFVDIPGVSNEFWHDGACGGVVKNKFYIFGGNESGTDDGDVKAWVFDPNAPEGKQMTRINDVPVPLGGPPESLVYQNKIYIVGGTSGGDYIDSIIVYDPATKKYSARHTLTRATVNHAVALYKDKMYITYGYAWGNEEENKVGFRMHPAMTLEYDIKNDKVGSSGGSLASSIKGDKMNVVLSMSDANKVTGLSQTLAVSWQASTASPKGVLYYRAKGIGRYTAVNASGTKYIVGLAAAKGYVAYMTKLKPDTAYEYYVLSEGDPQYKSEVFTFKTQAQNPNTFSFCVYGDSKVQYDVANELNGEILKKFKENSGKGIPGFTVELGDFGSIGAIPEYNAWFNYAWKKNYTRELVGSYPFFMLHGNHENMMGTYFNSFEFPRKAMDGWPDLNNKAKEEELWFSFNYGSAHIISLTSGYIGTEWDKRQFEWFKKDLAMAKQLKEAGKIQWIVVVAASFDDVYR